jgi:hypothetical protein
MTEFEGGPECSLVYRGCLREQRLDRTRMRAQECCNVP